MIAVLIALIVGITVIASVFICSCRDAISTYIDNTITMIETNRENRKLRNEVRELKKEFKKLKNEVENQ